MSIIENANEIAELVKNSNDIELYRNIIELERKIIELTREKHALELRVEELNKTLQTTTQMNFREPFYYIEGDPVPFCPKCWEIDKISIHLLFEGHYQYERKYSCPKCRSIFLYDFECKSASLNNNGWDVIVDGLNKK